MGEIALPRGWKVVKLEKICIKRKIRNPNKKPDIIFTYVDISSICNNSFKIIYTKNILGKDAPSRARQIIYKDDVIFATVRPTLKRVALVPLELDDQICSTGFCVLRANTEYLNPSYLYFYLLTNKINQRVQALQKGATYPAINDLDLFEQEIYLPPLAEQKSISHTLRTIQTAKETRQRELELERERKATFMEYLFIHGTRNEARKQTEIGEIPESWKVVRFEQVCEFFQYGTSKLCDSNTSDIPVLRIPNVIRGEIDISDLKFTKPEKKEFEKLCLESGDLLFVRTNGRKEYLGRCAVFLGKPHNAMFASYLIRARIKQNTILPEFIQFYTMTNRGKSYLSGKASNSADGKFNINTQTLKSVIVPFPSLQEQEEIAHILKSCDRKIQALKKEISLIDELFHATLEELMTGKLSTNNLIS